MPTRLSGNYEKAPRNRDSAFDRKLQQFRTTGEIDKVNLKQKDVQKKLTAEFEYPSADFRAVREHQLNELEQMAFIDPLTQTLNERTILTALAEEVRRAQRYHQSLGLMIVEIDDFEIFSQEAAPLALDNLVKSVASVLRKNTREVDILGRAAGKFMIVCPETGLGQLCVMGERLRNLFASARIASIGYTVSVTVSAGVSAYPQTGDHAEAVLAAALEALNRAREHGGNFLCEPSCARPTVAVAYSDTEPEQVQAPVADEFDFSPSDQQEQEALLTAMDQTADSAPAAVAPQPALSERPV